MTGRTPLSWAAGHGHVHVVEETDGRPATAHDGGPETTDCTGIFT